MEDMTTMGERYGLMHLCWICRWRKEALIQGMWASSRSWKWQNKTKQTNRFSPRATKKEYSLVNTLILAQCDPCQTFDLRNCKIINLKCLKPLSFQQLFIVSTEN